MKRLAAVALALAVLWPTAAHAQSDRCAPEPEETTSTGTTVPEDDDEGGENGLCATLLESLVEEQPGQFPTSHYDLGFNEGRSWNVGRNYAGWLMDQIFTVEKWVVGLGLKVVSFALTFGFADNLRQAAVDFSHRWQFDVVGASGVIPLFLTITGVWALVLAMTGRAVRGFSEIAVSGLIVALAVTAWARPSAWMTDGLDFAADTGGAISAAVADDNSSMSAAVHQAFVERPHEVLNWGRPIPVNGSDPCRSTYEELVAEGPWGPADEPRTRMREAGCMREMRWNEDPTGDRILGALLTLVAAALLMVLLVVIAFKVLRAQFSILGFLATSPFAFAAGALPGSGRTLFWRWCAGAATAYVKIVMAHIALAMVLAGVNALILFSPTDNILVTFILVDVLVLVGLFKLKSLSRGGQVAVDRFSMRMASSTSGRHSAPRVSWQSHADSGHVTQRATRVARQVQRDIRARRTLDLVRR